MHPQDGVARPSEVAAMFARIARRYDLMNRLMTFGMDGTWRRNAAEMATGSRARRALDVGTGTADLALELGCHARRVVGVDFCQPMIAEGLQKIRSAGRAESIKLLPADALQLPFADDSFDCVTAAFTIRNVPDLPRVFREMTRVIRPGGQVVCLELSPLQNRGLAGLFRKYFHLVVPVVGALVSGDRDAYRYLPASVDRFPSMDALARLMEEAGLVRVGFQSLNFGTVALHYGSK